MTTSVDILFKELPAMSRADDRIIRSDTSSIGSDYDRDRSKISKYEDDKAFDEHLEDHKFSNERPINNDHSKRNIPTLSDQEKYSDQAKSIEQDTISTEPYTVRDDKNKNYSEQETVPNAARNELKSNGNEEIAITNVNKPKETAPSFTTKDLMLTETTAEKSALQNNVYTAQNTIKSSASNISDQVIVNSASSKNTSDHSTGQQFEQNMSQKNDASQALPQINDIAVKKAPVFTVVTDNKVNKEQSETVQLSASDIAINNANEKITNSGDSQPINKPEKMAADEFVFNPKTAKYTIGPAAEESVTANIGEATAKPIENIIEQKSSAPNQPKTQIAMTEEPIFEEISSTISAMANTVNKAIDNADLMQKPVPQPETVAVESAKTLPFAVTQSPNNAQNSSSFSKKKGSSVSAATGVANQAASNNAAEGTAQNSISQAMLQNALKSDIQIDLGLNGQKFDAPFGQSMTPAGQSSLSTGSMLAAQDVNFQKTLSAISTTKADAPLNAKMINEQITVAINKNVVKGLNNFSIRLHPAELGQVDIKLEFAADGKMHAAMMVESEKTLTMLQRDQATLEKALQDAGINLSNKDMNFSLMKQNQNNNANKFAGINGAAQTDEEFDELTELGSMQEIRMAYSNQTLDISV